MDQTDISSATLSDLLAPLVAAVERVAHNLEMIEHRLRWLESIPKQLGEIKDASLGI